MAQVPPRIRPEPAPPPHRALARWRQKLEPAIRRVFHLYWRFSRAITFGVRALVIDASSRVFLVRHSYLSGWYLPGGGVEVGETVLQALERELMEEGNITLTGPPLLHGVFFNTRVSRRDHVVLFVVRAFRQDGPPIPNREIVEHGFFPLDALPADTSRASRARIAEVLHGAPASPYW